MTQKSSGFGVIGSKAGGTDADGDRGGRERVSEDTTLLSGIG